AEQPLQLSCGADDGLLDRWRLVCDGGGRPALEACLHHAPHVGCATLLRAVLIAEVHLDPGDAAGESVQRALDFIANAREQCGAALDVAVGLHQNVHAPSLTAGCVATRAPSLVRRHGLRTSRMSRWPAACR